MRRFKKGDFVYYVDEYARRVYPERGTFEARTTDGRIVIQSYFGLFILPKRECYFTKEECQETIDKALKEGEDNADKT